MGLKVLSLENDLVAALEKETTFNEHIKTESFVTRVVHKSLRFLIKKIGFMPPAVFFEKEDIDYKVVHKLLEHPELLDAILTWIEDIDYSVLPQLKEAKQVFEKIQKPRQRDAKLYRAFNINSGQQALGLEKNNKGVKPGEKFTFLVDKPMSFSSYHDVSKVYGDVVVTVNYSKEDKRMLHITNEIFAATIMHSAKMREVDDVFIDGKMYSYFESVFLPDGKSLEFTLMNK